MFCLFWSICSRFSSWQSLWEDVQWNCDEFLFFLLPWFDFRGQRKLGFSETTQSDDGDDNHLIVLFHLQHADPGAIPGQLKKLQFVWGSHKRVFLVGNELPGLKTQAQHIAALPVLLPQPLCHPFDHPVKDMKAGTLKMASAQVFISEQSYINIWGTRRLIIGCFVDHSGQRIHHSRHHCQEPGGVKCQRLRTGKKFNWNTSLNAKTTVCPWCLLALVRCLPASVPQLSQILFKMYV